jgi:hypothetical protein
VDEEADPVLELLAGWTVPSAAVADPLLGFAKDFPGSSAEASAASAPVSATEPITIHRRVRPIRSRAASRIMTARARSLRTLGPSLVPWPGVLGLFVATVAMSAISGEANQSRLREV